MTAIAGTNTAVYTMIDEGISKVSKVRSACRSLAKRIGGWIEKSWLIQSCVILGLNTVQLAGRLFSKIPSSVVHWAGFGLSYIGLIGIGYQLMAVMKSLSDCRLALRDVDVWSFVASGAKATLEATGIGMTLGHCVASVIAVAGHPEVTMAIYGKMAPIGTVSTVGLVLLDIYDYFSSRSQCKRLSAVRAINDPDERQKEIQAIFERLVGRKSSGAKVRPARVVRLVSGHTWPGMKKKIGELLDKKEGKREEFDALYKQLIDSVKLLGNMTGGEFLLRCLGYAAMFVGSQYKGRLPQIVVTWAMSLLYTLKQVWFDFKQTRIKREVSKI